MFLKVHSVKERSEASDAAPIIKAVVVLVLRPVDHVEVAAKETKALGKHL